MTAHATPQPEPQPCKLDARFDHHGIVSVWCRKHGTRVEAPLPTSVTGSVSTTLARLCAEVRQGCTR